MRAWVAMMLSACVACGLTAVGTLDVSNVTSGGDAGPVPGTDGSVEASSADSAVGGTSCKHEIVIDNTGIGALASFAVLVVLDDTRISYARTKPGGADLELRDTSGATLAHEIEQWAPGGRSILWVRVPSIPANATTTISMHYGGTAAGSPKPPPASVWDSDYVGVWHLSDAHDSTEKHDSGNVGATSIDGRVGPAMHFDGASHYIDTGSDEQLAQWTIEVWMRAAAVHQTGVPISGPLSRAPNYSIQWNCTGTSFCRSLVLGSSSAPVPFGDLVPAVWYHLAGTFDGTTAIGYADGENVGSITQPIGTFTGTAKIGARSTAASGEFFTGEVDEVRISKIVRSADYMKAQVRSMKDAYLKIGPCTEE